MACHAILDKYSPAKGSEDWEWLLQLAATPLAFWYISSAKGMLSDVAAIVFIALFWLQSGVVNSASFVMAPKWARPGVQVPFHFC